MAKRNTTTKLMLNITHSVLRLFLNIIFYALVLLIVLKGSSMIYHFSYQVFGSVSVAEEGVGREYTLQIADGDSTMGIASKLASNQIIVNRYSFYIRAKLTKQNIQPGTYTIDSTMDYDEIFEVIAQESTKG